MRSLIRQFIFLFAAVAWGVSSLSGQTLSTNSVYFGAWVVGTSSTARSVTFKNSSTVSLTITSIGTSGDFAQTSNCPITPNTLGVGASCTINVTFTPAALGGLTGSLVVTDSAGNSPQIASLSGSGVAPVTLSANDISFGKQILNTTSTAKNVVVRNNQTSRLSITSIATSGDFAQTSNCPSVPNTLAGGANCTIALTFTPTVLGPRSGNLVISNDASNSPQTAVMDGNGVTVVQLSTASLTFASQVVNTTSPSRTVTFTNNQSIPLTIASIISTGDFAQSSNCPIAPNALAGGGSCTISIAFIPTALGTRTGALVVSDNVPTSPQQVSLLGTGSLTGLTSISVTPANPSIPPGSNQQFIATGTFNNGSTQNITNFVSWTSSATKIATISAAGLASALAQGATTIRASSGSITGATTLGVTSAATLISIAVTPGNPTIAVGQTQPFIAKGTYSDSSTQNLTNAVTWSSSASSIATIASGGVASGVGAGSSTISAAMGSITGSTNLTVNPAVLVSLAVTPAGSSIALGTTQQFTATGLYSDGSTLNLTSSVTWASSGTSVATISSAAGNPGQAVSVATGQTTISATLGAITGLATLTITPATLVSMAITPAIPSIALGATKQFAATGTYTDGSQQDITSSVQWSSSNAAIATISNAAGTQGLANGVATGTASISATLASISGSTTLSVGAAALVSIALTPANPAIALGTVQQFTATGTFTDNGTHDLTSTASWTSSDTTVTAVSASGLAASVATGTATITASAGGVSGSTVLTVSAAALVSIAVTPANASITWGTTQQFTAAALFTDGSTQDVTTSAHWGSSAASVATISNTAGSNGLATSTGAGTTTISASSGSVSGNANLTVSAAGGLVSIAITPQSPSLPLATTLQFTATGNYSDGSSQNITSAVIWASSAATVATISNSSGTQGLATSSGTGITTITATLGAVSATTTLTVQTAALVSLSLTPQNPSLPLGTTLQFTATGNYSDGSSQNITSAVIWASSVATTATISNSSGTQGLATSSGTGITTISATLGAINASTTLTVQTAALVSLGIIPQNPTIVVGTTQQFTATGTYSDGTTRDLTASTSWSSSPVAAATISNAPGTIGLARGVGSGTATITGASGSQSGTANLTVAGFGQPQCFYTTSWNTGSVSYLGNAITHSETGKNYFIFDGPAFYVASPCITSNLAFVVGQVDIYKTHYACQGGPSTANNGASCNYCSGTSCQPVPSVCKGGASCSGPLPNNYDVGIYCVGGGACNFGQLYAHVGPLAVAQFFDCANHPTQCALARYLAIGERYVLKLSWVSGPVSLPTGNYAIGMATNCDSSKQPETVPGRASGDSGCGAGMGEGGPYGYGSANPRVGTGTQLMSFKYFTQYQPCLVYDDILGLPANIGPGSACNFSSIPANGAGQAPHILNFAIY